MSEETTTDGVPLRPPKSRYRIMMEQAEPPGEWVGGLALIILIGWLSTYAAPSLASESQWAYWWRYSFEVGAAYDDVSVAKRPKDCDFLTAPLGRKNCWYEARVTTVRTRVSNGKTELAITSGTGPTLRDVLPWRWPKRDTAKWESGGASARPLVVVSFEKVAE